jgi:hypothetical protein
MILARIFLPTLNFSSISWPARPRWVSSIVPSKNPQSLTLRPLGTTAVMVAREERADIGDL